MLTKTIVREAKGQVLMIDEAYMLDPNRGRKNNSYTSCPFRQGVIDTLVGEVQNSPGEDLCVILCGYKEDMELMLQGANPGLARRFPVMDAFTFEEFDLPQLEKVLELKMERGVGCTMTPEAKQLALQKLRFAKEQQNFGNGGEIDNLLGRAIASFRHRFGNNPPEVQSGNVCLEPEDVDPSFENIFHVEDHIDSLFEGLVQIENLKEPFRGLARRSTFLRRNGRDPTRFMPFYFVFKGADSTSKWALAVSFPSPSMSLSLRYSRSNPISSFRFFCGLSEAVPPISFVSYVFV